MIAMRELTKPATGTVKVGCYKGNIFFLSLTGVEGTLYNEADSSMEASDGLNPVSSQGYAEVQSVEARSLARAGQVGAHAIEQPSESQPPPLLPTASGRTVLRSRCSRHRPIARLGRLLLTLASTRRR